MKQPYRLSRTVQFAGRGILLAALVLAAIPACRLSSIPLYQPGPLLPDSVEVERIDDIAYGDEPEAGSFRHHLDLFLPKGREAFPVVLLVHGGAWIFGDNRCCGLYSSVGSFLASRGIGVVVTNYQQSPGVRHPAHIKDVAKAFAWTHDHIAEYGGCTEQIFLLGHSAGGHLAALLATDESYLKAEGLATRDIKGVITLSGVYHIPQDGPVYTLGGPTPLAFRIGQLLPLRIDSNWCGNTNILPGIPWKLNVFYPAFGNDPAVRDDASPVNHVRPELPPFLLGSAEFDLPTLPEMAEEFHKALIDQGNESTLLKFEKRNHNSIMFKAVESEDPVGRAVVTFIQDHMLER
jgi:acetyl esterase/lipase